jgi:activator of HSP90 ATPase
MAKVYKTYQVENISNMKCYQYVDTPNNVICVYNTTSTYGRMSDTITINRKKETETLYSINALNMLIQELNNGVLDKSYRIEWNQYQNKLILSDRSGAFRLINVKELQ